MFRVTIDDGKSSLEIVGRVNFVINQDSIEIRNWVSGRIIDKDLQNYVDILNQIKNAFVGYS